MTRTRVLFCLLWVALLATPQATHANATVQLALLPDSLAPLSAAAVTNGSLDEAFQPVPTLRLTPPREQQRWYRLQLDADWSAATQPLLAFEDLARAAPGGHIWVYHPPSYAPVALGLAQTAHAGFALNALVARLPPTLRAGEPIYIRIGHGNPARQIGVTLTDLASYRSAELNHVRLMTLFESIQLAMILVGLFLLVTLRERLFLYFVGYLAAELLYGLSFGLALVDLPGLAWLASPWLNLNAFFACLAVVLAISFIIEFCDLRSTTARTARVFGWLRWPLLVISPFALFQLRIGTFVITLVNLMALLAAVMAITIIVQATLRGNRQARYFLVAWMPQLALLVFRIVQLQADWPQPAWLEYGVPASMAFSSLVITLGVSDKILRARQQRDVAEKLARHDVLTGVLNRRALLDQLNLAVDFARQHDHPLTVLFIDADHFKQLNDTHGHAAGDRCLQAIVEAMKLELRAEDCLGRYGGEEFLVVLPGTTCEIAEQIAERVRSRVEALKLTTNGHKLHTTISVGIAGLLSRRDTSASLIERADEALYRAKSEGRNRVSIHSSTPGGTQGQLHLLPDQGQAV